VGHDEHSRSGRTAQGLDRGGVPARARGDRLVAGGAVPRRRTGAARRSGCWWSCSPVSSPGAAPPRTGP